MLMELCPCCGVRLLRHASKSGAYLRCGSCRFEIPEELSSDTEETKNLSSNLVNPLDTAEIMETTTVS